MTGPLPSVTAMKRFVLTIAAAVAWFLPGHLVILALLVFFWGTAMMTTANTAKARGTEVRLNGVVTALGTTNSNVTAAQSTASSAQSTANAAQATANGALPASGGTISGSLTVTGNVTVDSSLGVHGGTTLVGTATTSSDLTVGGNFTADNTATILGSCGIHGGANIIGRIGSSYNIPQTAPGHISGTGTLSQLTNCCNSLIDTFIATGVAT